MSDPLLISTMIPSPKPAPCGGLGTCDPVLSPAQIAGKIENQEDEQDESKPTSAYQRSADVKSAATEQEHQHNQKNE